MTYKPANIVISKCVDPATGLPATSIDPIGALTCPNIAAAYGIPASDGEGIKIAIISEGGGFLQSDIDKLFVDMKATGQISSSIPTPTINQVLVAGATGTFSIDDNNASLENTLDIAILATMVPKATITIYIGIDLASAMTQAWTDNNHIMSISWATNENVSGDHLGSLISVSNSSNIAICAASGDWGSTFAGGSSLAACYPAISPYVIGVGGTSLTINNSNVRVTESDFNYAGGGSGGAISTLFTVPSYQNGLYYTPITSNIVGSPTPLTHRGSPDISAPYYGYPIYYNGEILLAAGTSASTPFIAGMLARMQKLTGIQRSSLAYNTIFYANKSAFYDITVGQNNDLITDGYAGTQSWDPVTGLGPPIGDRLYTVLSGGTLDPYVFSTIPTSINEGSTGTFNVSTLNIADGTTLYWTVNTGTSSSADFSAISGSFTINNNTGSFTVTTSADLTTEGSETFTVSIRTISTSGSVVATSNSVTINDTSTTPASNDATLSALTISSGTLIPSFSSGTTSYKVSVSSGVSSVTVTPTRNESHATITVNGSSVTSGSASGAINLNVGSNTITIVVTAQDSTTKTYTIIVGDFANWSGSFTIDAQGLGSFSVTPSLDLTTEGAETFTVSIRTGSISGPVVGTSELITINDTSVSP